MARTSTRVLLVALSLSIVLFLRAHLPGWQAGSLSVPAAQQAQYDTGAHGLGLDWSLPINDYGGVAPRMPAPAPQGPSGSPSGPTGPDTPTDTPTSTTPTPSSTTPTSTTPTSTTQQTSSTSVSQSIVVVTVGGPTPVKTSTSETSTGTGKPGDNSSIKPGTIIGLSVAGGIAVMAVVAFLVWKVTRKRFSEFDGDGEAIKWPELNNNETHALPVRATGRSGIDTSPPRQHSDLYSDSASNANSDLHPSSHDMYAVPPLPNMNPNQPYRDDGYGNPAYYDPYRGPVPQTFQGGAQPPPSQWGMQGGEAIAMSGYPPSARSRSPGPAAAYGYDQRTGSPAPSVPSHRQASPGPNMAYGAQPGIPRHTSPGPAQAYGGYPTQQGRASPGPNTAYSSEDAYGGIS